MQSLQLLFWPTLRVRKLKLVITGSATFERAIQIADSFKGRLDGNHSIPYVYIAKAYAEAGNLPVSQEMFKRAKEKTKDIFHAHIRADALVSIARVQVFCGDKNGGEQTLSEALQVAGTLSSNVGRIGYEFAEMGNHTASEEIFQNFIASMESIPVNTKAQSLILIAGWQLKAHQNRVPLQL
jgi:hypothetical protein